MPVRRIDCMVVSLVKRSRGRPKRRLEEIIKGNLRLNNISKTLVFNCVEWHQVIHVADLT